MMQCIINSQVFETFSSYIRTRVMFDMPLVFFVFYGINVGLIRLSHLCFTRYLSSSRGDGTSLTGIVSYISFVYRGSIRTLADGEVRAVTMDDALTNACDETHNAEGKDLQCTCTCHAVGKPSSLSAVL